MLASGFVDAVDATVRTLAVQIRKGSPTPCTSHVLAVVSLVVEPHGDEDQTIAGVLHDVVEGCDPQK